MKKTYQKPVVEIYQIDKKDEVIVTSGGDGVKNFFQGGHFFAEEFTE